MYKCCNCGAIFEEPGTIWTNKGEYFGDQSLVEEECCPFCKNDFYPINNDGEE